MLTIGQLAAYAGVTVRAVRHYHHVGLLPEPERDASGYRRYGAVAVVALIKIRTLADAGVPLSRIAEMIEADPDEFAGSVAEIDDRLSEEIERLERSRKQIAQLAVDDSLAVPPEVAGYLDRLRRIGASERVIEGERDGWILLAARWPERVREVMPAKIGYLDDPRIVRLYRLLSEVFEPGADESGLEELADLMAELNEEAYRENLDDARLDDLAFDLLEAFAVESDPRARRLMELMQDRGWSGWIRLEKSPGRSPGGGDDPVDDLAE